MCVVTAPRSPPVELLVVVLDCVLMPVTVRLPEVTVPVALLLLTLLLTVELPLMTTVFTDPAATA